MKSIFARLPKKALFAVATLATAIGAMTAVNAWSPDRPTYTIESPAPHVTFNSITNNPNYGDERTFFDAKDASNTAAGGFADNVQVTDGQELLLRVYVHNNAASNLNTVSNGNGGYVGVAENTKVRVFLPTATDSALRANAYISASNATPTEVADTVDFNSASKFAVEYVPGSAMIYTNAIPAGTQLSDTIVTTGAPIGYDQLNGKVPGCFQYTSIVTIRVKVKKPAIQVQKTVRKAVYNATTQKYEGTGDFVENLAVSKGDVLQYQIAVLNSGSATMNDVVVGDNLPPYVSYINNTTTMKDSNFPNGDGTPLTSNNITKGGINELGAFPAGSGAKFRFMAKVADSFSEGCGTLTLTNVGIAKSDQAGNTVEDTAVVTVDSGKVCTTPTYECKAVTATLNGKVATITVDAPVSGGATVKQYSYTFGDGSATMLTDKNPVTHTYATGTYKISVVVTFNVGSSTQTAACSTSVTIPAGPTTLVKTGPASTIGLFAGVTAAAALAHNMFVRRRAMR